MIISQYGKKFLNYYNKENNSNYTPKDFFVNEFYPIFFGGNKDLMFIKNSPFSNPSNKKKGTSLKLKSFFQKIHNLEFDGCMFIGGSAKEKHAPTSFNVSTIYEHDIDENEIYYSWIGQALSVNIGGLLFLFDNEEILYNIYNGWQRYYDLLNQPLYSDYKGSQINTWNGHWLNNFYEGYRKKPFNVFNPLLEYKDSLKSISWIKLLFNLSRNFQNNNIDSYVYKLGQTNETYGHITFNLKKINNFLDFCTDYFGENLYLSSPELFEQVYGSGYSIQKICDSLSYIGFNEIKPELIKLEEYTHKSNDVIKKINKHYKDIKKSKTLYKLNRIYLMAKINLKDIETKIDEISDALHSIKDNSRKNSEHQIDELLSSRSKTKLFNSIDVLVKDTCLPNKLSKEAMLLNELRKIVSENETKMVDLITSISIVYNIKSIK